MHDIRIQDQSVRTNLRDLIPGSPTAFFLYIEIMRIITEGITTNDLREKGAIYIKRMSKREKYFSVCNEINWMNLEEREEEAKREIEDRINEMGKTGIYKYLK